MLTLVLLIFAAVCAILALFGYNNRVDPLAIGLLLVVVALLLGQSF